VTAAATDATARSIRGSNIERCRRRRRRRRRLTNDTGPEVPQREKVIGRICCCCAVSAFGNDFEKKEVA